MGGEGGRGRLVTRYFPAPSPLLLLLLFFFCSPSHVSHVLFTCIANGIVCPRECEFLGIECPRKLRRLRFSRLDKRKQKHATPTQTANIGTYSRRECSLRKHPRSSPLESFSSSLAAKSEKKRMFSQGNENVSY